MRDDTYRMFGPNLVEALLQYVNRELNALRKALGQKESTVNEIEVAVTDICKALTEYEWQKTSGTTKNGN
jgi:hypothetical protein